jgi:hypothetical protein
MGAKQLSKAPAVSWSKCATECVNAPTTRLYAQAFSKQLEGTVQLEGGHWH